MPWRRSVPRVAALALTVAACAATPPAAEPAQPPVTPPAETQTPSPARGSLPELHPWERQVGEARENRGVARVERMGKRWMLTVMCTGQHAVYLDDTTLDLDKYSKGYVTARYRWVTRMVQVQCIKAPCNPQPELRLALEQLTVVSATEARARELAKDCGASRD